eukprot:CAMPEP_0113489628 /NCGR_PEP_ID=MMETSP0014_2-20120614/26627_1 /TAXON_ID=2857 /ORGANISM="Nitzschia sp." /LENGTH=712 /DNA_ID=CAMNT_0000383371 /DNA_START=93 /DNA_END=2231 /DNA_ORIENTATION=- /assembly_acc=CAM_ASM_000159
MNSVVLVNLLLVLLVGATTSSAFVCNIGGSGAVGSRSRTTVDSISIVYPTATSLHMSTTEERQSTSENAMNKDGDDNAVAAAAAAADAELPNYTSEQLKGALDSLLEGSTNPDYDGRHLFGYGNPDHELSKLQAITATRILDYERYLKGETNRPATTEEELKTQMDKFWSQHGPLLSLQDVIQRQAPRMALAAEFKRASPSKGNIAVHLDAGEQATKYASAGADIISVLTEPRWFLGSLGDMTQVRLATTEAAATKIAAGGSEQQLRPAVLRKEFTTSKYQITEALASGADTILLIVAVLPQHLLKELIDHARSFGMEPLVEVHADSELDVALEAGAKVIGVNNRNLHTFEMDLANTEHVADQLNQRGHALSHSSSDSCSDYTLCSLSGMSTAWDVDRYRQINVGMCLIGESLMRAADPQAAIASLCLDPSDWEKTKASSMAGGAYTGGTKLVKVCGVTNPEDALVACQAGANLVGVIFVPKSKRCVSTDQAQAVVDTVRKFGERKSAESLRLVDSTNQSALSQLVANTRSLEEAARRPLVVGVFQNQSPEFIREMVDTCGLDLVQLHGKEGMEAANININGVPAIRVVDIEVDPETGKASSTAVDAVLESITTDPLAILLDTSIKGSQAGGGTGVTFDWDIAEKIQNAGLPVIIAGGLTPENVAEAVQSTRPWGVDVSSGVEAQPGTKNHDSVRTFVQGARKAATEANKGF